MAHLCRYVCVALHNNGVTGCPQTWKTWNSQGIL